MKKTFLPLIFIIDAKIEYKKSSKEGQANYTLSQDMINLSHAKKAQALASDLEYRTRLHDYTVMADDIKVQQAKKAYSLQSEVRGSRRPAKLKRGAILKCLTASVVAVQNQYRSDLNWMKGVGWEVEGCLNVTQAKKAGELLSDVSMMLRLWCTCALPLNNNEK